MDRTPDPRTWAHGVRLLRAIGARLALLPRTLAWLPIAGWMTLITGLSSIPGRAEPGGWWRGVLANGMHAPLYGLLALWMCLALPREDGWPRVDAAGALAVLGGVLAFSVVDELHQSLTPGRDFSMCDVITNLTGAACVLWIARYVRGREAGDRGLLPRLAAGVGVCFCVAGLTTFLGERFPEIYWL